MRIFGRKVRSSARYDGHETMLSMLMMFARDLGKHHPDIDDQFYLRVYTKVKDFQGTWCGFEKAVTDAFMKASFEKHLETYPDDAEHHLRPR